LHVGVTPIEVKEIVYQAIPYVGTAKVFDVLHVTNEVYESRSIELPLPEIYRQKLPLGGDRTR
jgi:4-carboxymuconolactone decarboxylase